MSGKGLVVLGCTGSIGETTFQVLEGLGSDFRVVGLSAGRNIDGLVHRARQSGASLVCVGDEADIGKAGSQLPGVQVLWGDEGLSQLATAEEADIVVNGLVGAVGLIPTLAALEAGKTVAMANKEPIVMAGGLILEAAARGQGQLVPVDSEPNAMWQCLRGESASEVRRLILTASGGAFRGRTRQQMRDVTPQEALRHPTWNMGAKITVDSATLMNKGFEVIEASWLFGVDVDRVDVVVHRESVVHSMVEFADGAILAHMGRTHMALPIQYALTHPQRRAGPLEPLDLTSLGALHFEEPDTTNFPCLDLCYEAGRRGGTTAAALNAANEVAVEAFLGGELGFLEIGEVNARVLESHVPAAADTVGAVLAADAEARDSARQYAGEFAAAAAGRAAVA